jgi:hypothetical protein
MREDSGHHRHERTYRSLSCLEQDFHGNNSGTSYHVPSYSVLPVLNQALDEFPDRRKPVRSATESRGCSRRKRSLEDYSGTCCEIKTDLQLLKTPVYRAFFVFGRQKNYF